ncbi:helicase C-terminal domain-containing protein [Moorella sulfitireducens]|uniref:helicase C-terminal domain-containing protein n=1 Tax=Neomoorella sulfitireducens TaxID=2972948 RepID=UPI0021AD19E7|nr:helicase C-terminal domain-containing protein [Moorella sulfitireducens]
MLPYNYIVVDIETTGLDPDQDQIIEIAAVRLEGGRVTGKFHTLVNPGRPIPSYIQKLTGINDAMVGEAPPLAEILPGLLDFMKGAFPAGHNGNFDLAFLNRALGNTTWHLPLLDTLTLSRILYPCLPSYRLEFLSQKFSFDAGEHHRAMGDALATVQLLHILWQATLTLDKHLLSTFFKLAPAGLQPWFRAALDAEAIPATTEEVAATGLFAPEQPLLASPSVQEYSPDEITALLGPGGLLACKLPGYEYRPQQAEMLRAVATALAGHKYLIVEAGTGTGKSLAYLLPAVYWACHQGKRVAIATHTISLQEQLWNKDLPLLKEVLPFSFRAALVKGRNNYLCRRKLRDYQLNPPPGTEERHFLLRVLRWFKQTASGDWSEMKLNPEEESLKLALAADKDTCAGNSCPFNDSCFVNAARQEAESANILILNHSLLLSDARLNNQVLADYPYLIIDEAHHLEEAATEHLGVVVRQSGGEFFIQRLGNRNINFSFLGRAWALAHRLAGGENAGLLAILDDIEGNAARIRREWQAFWDCLARLHDACLWENNNSTLRFTARLRETPAWDTLLGTFGQLEETFNSLAGRLARLAELLYAAGAEETAADAANLGNIFAQISHDMGEILEADPETFVSWLEINNTGQYTLHLAPLEAGTLLADLLFTRKKAVILTSATITVNNSFDFYQQQVGLTALPPGRVITCQVPSPFDYHSQALVCTVKGLPNPGQLNDSAYAAAITPVIAEILPAVDGRTLILCTSHRFLRDVYNLLSGMMDDRDYTVLAQGIDGGRSQLLEEFRQTPRSVLLGASSYWEGIDLPGDLLRCLIIPRLPFPSPGMPVLAARMEHLAAKGGNPFTALSLPQAIIRFRQGFGRLIRSSIDRGALVVLDQRLLSQRYGRYFLQSLPPVTTAEVTPEELPEKLKAWFNPDAAP